MSLLKKLFGGKKKDSGEDLPTAIQRLRDTEAMLNKESDLLKKKIDEELKAAKTHATKNTQKAIQRLRDTEEMLNKKSDFLEKKIDEELQAAKTNETKNKRAALQALRRKKRYEKRLGQIDGTLSTIELQREALENAMRTAESVKTAVRHSGRRRTVSVRRSVRRSGRQRRGRTPMHTASSLFSFAGLGQSPNRGQRVGATARATSCNVM